MSMEFVQQLPEPEKFKRDFPVEDAIVKIKKERDKEISDVLTGKSDKFLVIIGPCSADGEDAVYMVKRLLLCR